MKRNVIAVIMSIVMAVGNTGTVPVYASETTAQEAEVEGSQLSEGKFEEAYATEETDLEENDANGGEYNTGKDGGSAADDNEEMADEESENSADTDTKGALKKDLELESIDAHNSSVQKDLKVNDDSDISESVEETTTTGENGNEEIESKSKDHIFRGTVSITTEGSDSRSEDDSGKSPLDLFSDYVDNSFGIQTERELTGRKKASRNASSNLYGIDKTIYDIIAGYLPLVAAGKRASTIFEISVDELGLEKTFWTAGELGVASIFVLDENGDVIVDEEGNASVTEEALYEVGRITHYDLSKIVSALRADNPYHLYWYEKTKQTTATGYEVTASYDDVIGDYVIGIVNNFTISFPVAEEFSVDEYTVDSSIGQSVQASVESADSIIDYYNNVSDYEKLCGYKNEICKLVDYNYEAVEGDASYGNPWQLIWVFDEEPSTNVVCEGYAKAFKYLCDRTVFDDDISCITVTGMMNGGIGEGPHMWNIVNMDDDQNYLVDVTNCDDGAIGEPDLLFLRGSAIDDGSYTFTCGGQDVRYTYDEMPHFSPEDLVLSEFDYNLDWESGDDPQDDIASGFYGSVPWRITSEGELQIGEAGKEYTFEYGGNTGGWPWYPYASSIISGIVLGDVHGTGSMSGMFFGLENMTTLDLSGFDTSDVTCMGEMFYDCSSMSSLNLSGLNTDKCLDMTSMFANCSSLPSLDLTGFNTSNVTSMFQMFINCSSLVQLNVSSFNTGNVENMARMFEGCKSLQMLDLSGFDTSNVTNMMLMFSGCGFNTLDLTSFDTSNVTDMTCLLSSCENLTNLDITSFDTSKVVYMGMMFSGCGFTTLDLTNFDTSNVVNMYGMFTGCKKLQSVDLSSFDTSNTQNMAYMFQWCQNLKSLDLSNFDTSNVTDMSEMFAECNSLTNLDLSTFDTSNVTKMKHMFFECDGLISIDLSGFDTGNVTNMQEMFYSCKKLTSIDLSNFDTGNVKDMSGMFRYSTGLVSLDLSNFNTSNVTTMSEMFDHCDSLRNVDLTGFNTNNVTDMSKMFYCCTNLLSLDLSDFDTKNVLNFDSMLYYCRKLTYLDLSGFDTSNAINTSYMLGLLNSLQTLIPGENMILEGTGFSYSPGLPVIENRIDETCTTDGSYDKVVYCTVCRRELSRQKQIIPAAGHTLTYVEAVPATYEKDGNTEYYLCTTCGESFSDEAGEWKIEEESIVIPQLIWISVSSISLNKSEVTVNGNAKEKLEVIISPDNATNQNVNWTSSNEDVAVVDENGTVTGGESGEAVITVTAEDGGISAHCMVHVVNSIRIVTQPADRTATLGERVYFKVEAEGEGLSYQWQWSTDGNIWKNCRAAGYNNPEFSFEMASIYDGRQYRCRVKSGAETAYSEAAKVTLKNAVTIITDPADAEVKTGETAVFTVEAEGEDLRYQWQWSADGNTWKNCTASGYNNPEFSFQMAESYDRRQYRCRVKSGAETAYSEAATAILKNAVTIITDPADAEAKIGETAVFTVEAEGEGLSYQWQWSADGDTWKNCRAAGYDNPEFSFQMAEPYDGRQYRCRVKSGAETAYSKAAMVILKNAVSIITDPADAELNVGETAVFTVEAEGEDLRYQWQWSADGSTWKNCTGAGYNTEAFSFKVRASYAGRQYRCRVTSGMQKAYTNAAVLSVISD